MTSLLPRVASLLAVCGPAAAAFADAAAPAAPTPPEAPPAAVPFAFADFTWLNGNSRTKDSPLQTKAFTGEFRADTSYIFDFAHPKDHTLGGTSESVRTDEFQVQQLGIGGDFHYDNMIGRLMTQFGMYSTMTPRNDASPVVGQWGLADAYRYISEAYGGYHPDAMNGINIEAGGFFSSAWRFCHTKIANTRHQPPHRCCKTPGVLHSPPG